MLSTRRSFLLGAGALLSGCGSSVDESVTATSRAHAGLKSAIHDEARAAMLPFAPRALVRSLSKLVPIHQRTTTPKPGEWLYDHPETGQSFEDYLESSPTVPTRERRAIVVQPLGNLAPASEKIIALTARFLEAHLGLTVRALPPVMLETPPPSARRFRFGAEQYLTQWLLKEVLPQHLPGDAMALVAFLETDLWPGENWNFVFGEATLSDRVGVWSLHRYGDPSQSPRAFKLALRRALKIAAHETGHMFSLHHCTRFKCLQSGVNSLEEADASPLWLCPDCLAKICWATATDPRVHLRRVGDFCREQALDEEALFFRSSLELLEIA